jgi:O-antigen/teichoic acid export membrane protein
VTARASYSSGAGFGVLSFAVFAILAVVSSIVTARLYGIAVIGQFALVIAPVGAVWYLSSAREGAAFVRKLAVLEPRDPRCTGLFAAVSAFSIGLTLLVTALALPIVYLLFNGPIDRPSLFVPSAVSLAGYALITNSGANLDVVFSAFRAGRELFWIRLHQAVAFIALAVALRFAVDDVWGLVAATLGSSATSLVHRVLAVRAFMVFRVPRSEVREGFRTLPELIRFGLKIVPGSLASGVCTEVGTWVLAITASVSTLGAYNRAWMLTNRLHEVHWRITEMLFPTLVGRRSSGDAAGFDRALVDTLRYCGAGLLLPAAAGGGAAASVMALFGPGFERAATALAVLLAVPAATAFASTERAALLAVDRPWVTSVIAGVKMAVTVVASIALTLWIGITGTALALLAGALVEVAWMGALTGRYLDAPLRVLWPRHERAAMIFAYVVGFAAARAVVSVLPGLAGLLPALATGAVAFALTLVAAGGVNDRDRARASALVARLRRRAGPVAAASTYRSRHA